MRPTDEHQTASTRPTFMSAARRGGPGDDNILARLERDAKRGKPGGGGHSWVSARLAWSALAGVAVVGLVGVLASLAQENVTVHRKPALTAPAPLTSEPHSSAPVKGGFAPLPEPSLSRAAAAIVDEQFKPAPMVMLKDEDEAAAEPAPVKPAPKRAAKPVRAPSSIAPAQTLAAAALARPAPPRPINAVPLRPRKPSPAPSAPPLEAPADSDVALLSAIIMHAGRHDGERAQMQAAARCPAGKKCAPPADLKATD